MEDTHAARLLAHASDAETAARLACWLGDVTSPDTLIRRQCAEPIIVPSPRVVGVDEFALRRGLTYATLVVDLERQHPVAVLEGRTAEPLIKWLQAHPSVTILVRDRADAYALAGRQAAPDSSRSPADNPCDRSHRPWGWTAERSASTWPYNSRRSIRRAVLAQPS